VPGRSFACASLGFRSTAGISSTTTSATPTAATTTAASHTTAKPPAAKKTHHNAKPTRRHRRARPHHAGRYRVPWHPDGISLVAHARNHHLAVYSQPRAKQPSLVLRNPDGNGTPRVVLVRAHRGDWMRVYLPTRPNGRMGWVRARAVELLRNPYRLVVRLRAHRLVLWKGQRVVLSAKTVVGASATPTPRGLYYIVELLRPPDPNGSYGPYSFGISAHSNVLERFAGGDGRVGIHGTNAPWLLGESVSHGCIRVRNDTIRRLARVLPLGTPVLIRA
jgi:hypothetical protein